MPNPPRDLDGTPSLACTYAARSALTTDTFTWYPSDPGIRISRSVDTCSRSLFRIAVTRIREVPALRSGGVPNDFQFGRGVHSRQELFNPRHCRLLQFGLTALAALEYRKGSENRDGDVADFER